MQWLPKANSNRSRVGPKELPKKALLDYKTMDIRFGSGILKFGNFRK
jgi:hypothetical protein